MSAADARSAYYDALDIHARYGFALLNRPKVARAARRRPDPAREGDRRLARRPAAIDRAGAVRLPHRSEIEAHQAALNSGVVSINAQGVIYDAWEHSMMNIIRRGAGL